MTGALLNSLKHTVGSKNLLTKDQLASRSNGYWDSSPIQALALITPENCAQLQAAVKTCHRLHQKMVIHGGLTGVAKGQLASADELAISLEKMTAITDFDPVGKTATVEAGCTLQQVQDFANQHGLIFPVDIGARGSCTIGGNIATNAGGMEVIRYGMMRNHVLGLEAVLADGSVLSAMNRMQKNNTGPDLKQLLIGSEGTLGIVTRAVLQFRPLPKTCNTAFIGCRDFNQLSQLLDSAQRNLGDSLTRFEIMDQPYYRLLTEPGNNAPPVSRECEWYALVESRGFEPETDSSGFQRWLEQLLDNNQIDDAAIAQHDRQRRDMWTIREVFDIAVATKPFFMYDVSLPLNTMASYISSVRSDIRSLWPNARFFILGHMADGNLHLFLSPCAGSTETELKTQADQIVYAPLQQIGGSVSAEHGIGLEKKSWLSSCKTESELALMKMLKQSMDPLNRLNPGRIFDL